jgi:hypothetical protein
METSFDARDFAPPTEPDDNYELPPSVRASAAASFEAPEYELPASMSGTAASIDADYDLPPPASVEPEAPAPFDAAAYDRPPSAAASFDAAAYEGPSSARASVEPAASVRESVEVPVEAAEPELELDVEEAPLEPPAAARSPVAELSPEVRDLLARAPPTASLVSDLFESADPASPPLGKVRASTTSVASVVTPPAAAPAPKNTAAPTVTPPAADEDPSIRLAAKLRQLEAMEASYAGEYGTLASIASMRLSRA